MMCWLCYYPLTYSFSDRPCVCHDHCLHWAHVGCLWWPCHRLSYLPHQDKIWSLQAMVCNSFTEEALLSRVLRGCLCFRLALSMVPLGMAYFMVWYVPPLDDHPQYIKFVYYLVFYFALLSLISVSKIAQCIDGSVVYLHREVLLGLLLQYSL